MPINNLNQTFPNSMELLKDPNMWITNSATTCHMSPHKQGMMNVHKHKSKITVSYGTTVTTHEQGNIPYHILDKHGKQMHKSTITDVVYVKDTLFNLFSLTKLMKAGWKLGGDCNKGITLTKDENTIAFDIAIPTKTANPSLLPVATELLCKLSPVGSTANLKGGIPLPDSWLGKHVKTESSCLFALSCFVWVASVMATSFVDPPSRIVNCLQMAPGVSLAM